MVSDTKCVLCGVSFNIARIRTVDEPREHAWNPYSSDNPGRAFAELFEADRDDKHCSPADRDYPGQEGCMAAFREDVVWRFRGLQGRSSKNGDSEWVDMVYGGLEDERIDLESDEGDENWVPKTSEGDEEMSEEETRYEYEGIPESCEGSQNDVADGSSDTADELEYQDWVDQVMTRHVYPYGPYPDNSTDSERIDRFRQLLQLSEEFRIKVPAEVKVASRVPIETLEEPLRSEVEAKHPDLSLQGGTGGLIPPHLFHPLNTLASKHAQRAWEHLAGPDCRVTAGYSGNRISVVEMLNCNVVQGILQKDRNVNWEDESTDEDWEGEERGGWHLTGLKDNIDGTGKMYPDRHMNRVEKMFYLDYINWNTGNQAMAFHPPCLEVFRRVSLKRNGRLDINALANWWIAEVNFKGFHQLPRDQDVRLGVGNEETWVHVIGTEYLAANPCFVPVLKNLLESSRKSNIKDQGPAVIHDIPVLPIEIQHLIVSYLDIGDIASLGAASRSLRDTVETTLERHFLHDSPHFWELWCDMPYSRWAGTTAAEIKEAQDTFEELEAEISNVLDVLQEEGHHEEYAQCKQYWDSQYAERKAKSRLPLQEKPSNFIDIKDIDLVNFTRGLEKALRDDQLKGLKNRKRIWVDCNMILDRIEAWQREDKVPRP